MVIQLDGNILNVNKTLRKNLIKYTPQKRLHNNNIINNMSSNIMVEDEFETTMDMEHHYYSMISSEMCKVSSVYVDRNRKDKIMKQFQIVKYEQFIPNWFVLFMKIRNHNKIVDNY